MARAAVPSPGSGSASEKKARTNLRSQLVSCKSIDKLIRESEEPENALKKSLGPWSLTALGIGAVIGSGIFTVIGTAMAGQKFDTPAISNTPLIHYLLTRTAMDGRPGAGPALALSLVLVAVVCVFTGLCYAELASMIPIAGSAYTYTYATLGELVAWIIGWDLIIEYAFGAATVAVGWSGNLNALLFSFGMQLPPQFLAPPGTDMVLYQGRWSALASIGATLRQGGVDPATLPHARGIVDLLAYLVIAATTLILVIGVRESANFNTAIVLVKVGTVITFVTVAAVYLFRHPGVAQANWHPFVPPNEGAFGQFGWSGVARGAGVIFFAYIGFDAVSTAAQEAKNPQRDMPIGILGSLAICTILYIGVAGLLTGVVKYPL